MTPEGRLDTELLQTFAQPQEEPPRRRYRFWVEFTPEDVAWFKAAAAERGFASAPLNKQQKYIDTGGTYHGIHT